MRPLNALRFDMDDFHARLADLAATWNRVEKRAKAAEQFRGEAIIPAINEMRYAGRRVVDALAAINDRDNAERHPEIDEHLTVARNYLTNADHDITDAVCFVVLKRVSATIEQHGMLRIKAQCPEFENLYPVVRIAMETVQGTREDRIKRAAQYKALAEDYQPKLEDLCKRLVDNRALALEDPSTGELRKIWRRIGWLNFIVVIGAFAGVAGLALEIYDLWWLRSRGGVP